jgi:cytochrome c peroxidase
METLGEALFHDVNLSFNRSQSCATCHNPEHGFIDNRLGDDNLIRPVSLGDDGFSLGDRNAPTAAYASITPEFEAAGTRERHNPHGVHLVYEGAIGGQFLDGRELDLKGQAGGPPLNPVEMGMPDKASVVARLQEDESYVLSFKALFGDDVFEDVDQAYLAMTTSIGRFEKTDLFAPFDSKYDRYLAGEVAFSEKEELGRTLFFSSLTNCSICHQLHDEEDLQLNKEETFSGYEYHNLGVPENSAIRQLNGVLENDGGLLLNAEIGDESARGKFKTPTLRNVAVTEPYMHNGVFRDLRTVVLFYEQYIDPVGRATNPETGTAWREAEITDTIEHDLLSIGRAMSDDEVDAMVCFLRTLTDERYEHLIQTKDINCASTDTGDDVNYPEIPASITDTAERGEFLYQQKYECWECHGDAVGLEPIPAPGDVKPGFIDRGGGLMDFLEGRITDQEMEELQAYLATI